MKRIWISVVLIIILAGLSAVPSSAYFNRGSVVLTLGQTTVDLDAGSSTSVSVGISPIKEQQLPGCGMAECPQTCGDSGCLNENGECTCGGLEYQTFYSSVSVVSSNSSVASADYGNGVLTVTGHSAGTAVITLTGSMRQYTDAVETLSVHVSSPKAQPSGDEGSAAYRGANGTSPQTHPVDSSGRSGGASSAEAGSPYGNIGTYDTDHHTEFVYEYVEEADVAPAEPESVPSEEAGTAVPESLQDAVTSEASDGVSVIPVEEKNGTSNDETETTVDESSKGDSPVPAVSANGAETVSGEGQSGMVKNVAGEESDGSRIIEAKRGTFEIVPLTESTDVRGHLQSAMDHDRYVTFQKKDGKNVEYSWTFDGNRIKKAKSLNLLGEIGTGVPESMQKISGSERGITLTFDAEETLPGEADLYVRVSSVFEDGETLTACRGGNGHEGEILSEDIPVENGYVTFSTESCEPIVLITEAEHHAGWLKWLIAAVAATAVTGAGILIRRKRKQGGK